MELLGITIITFCACCALAMLRVERKETASNLGNWLNKFGGVK